MNNVTQCLVDVGNNIRESSPSVISLDGSFCLRRRSLKRTTPWLKAKKDYICCGRRRHSRFPISFRS
jgi:hypothetical protein